MIAYVKIAKSGDSLVISIPREIRDAMKLAWRDQLVLRVDGDLLVVAKVSAAAEARQFARRSGER